MKEKRIIYLIMGVCSILILLIGITTAWFEWKSEVDTNVTFNVEGLNITYEGEPTVIKGNLYPTMYMNNTDNVIHNFSLVTTSNTEIHSKISLEIITLPTELNHESFRWNLYKDSTQIASGNFLNASVGTDILLTPYETITTTKSNYTLYIWIDGEHYDNPLTMGGQTFEFKLKLEASQQDYATAEECFVFYESSGVISDYLCIDGNTKSLPVITDVVIPSSINGVSVTKIGDSAFKSNNLTSVVIPDSVTTIGKQAFRDNDLTSVVIPDTVTTIGDSAFESNKLTSVVIPNSVTTIGAYAFYLNKLTSVVIPDSVTSIGISAFESNKLTSVVIPGSVTTIGGRAFYRNNLTNVVIPGSVTIIGDMAFSYNSITTVIIPDSVTTIGQYAFSNNNLSSVDIPDSVTSIGDSAFNNNQLPESQAYIYARNGDGSVDYTTIVSYGGAKRENVVIPNGVATIGKYAFESNNLTSVVIPDSVATIGNYAFYYNKLTSVTIGNSVTTIGKYAFYQNNLTSLVIPDSVTTIGGWAFSFNNLSSVYIGANSNLTETTGIGQSAFTSANRTSTSNGTTYVDNPNLTIYNNSGKKFKWYYVTQGRNDSTEDAYNFITGTVPSYSIYNEVTITTGGNP